MAVVASPHSHKQLDLRGSGHNTRHTPHSPGLMTEIMSYQYPPPPSNGTEMGLPPSGYMPAYDGLPHPEMGLKPEYDHSYSPRDRHDTLARALKLKRVMSTPNVRQEMPPPMQAPPAFGQQRLDEHSSMLQDGKKRNKLGYHRISVACNHCRRRKIRCIISSDDPEGRCINCIRLKKVCTFSAVDTQPAPEPRGKAGTRSVSMAGKPSSATASPAIPHTGGHQGEMYPAHIGMPPMPQMAPSRTLKTAGDAFSPDNKLPAALPTTRSFEYGHSGMTSWMGPDGSPNTTKPGDLGSNWRPYAQESPVTPVTFSPYSAHAPTPSTTWSPTATDPASRDDMPWSSYPPPQPRSMSFGSDAMGSPQNHHSQQQYPSISQMAGSGSRQYERKASATMPTDMYPPPIATGVEVIPGTTALDHGVSLSAGAVPPANYGTWHHPSYTYAAKPDGTYQSWYGENGTSQPLGSDGQVVHPAAGENQQHAGALYYHSR